MKAKLMECFANPIQCKLFLEISAQGQATAKQLAQAHSDIPQATLYRTLKKMADDGVIAVVEENKVRNVTEKVYAVAEDFTGDILKILDENAGDAYFGLFQQFTLGLLREFQEYARQPDIDIKRDGSGFSSVPFYATEAEVAELSAKVAEVLTPYYQNEQTPGRKMRTFARIITPPRPAE